MAPRKMKKNKMKEVNSNMSDKLVVEVEERSLWSVFAGMVMIFLGIMLVVVGIVALLLYRVEPKLDKSINTPVLTVLPSSTSAHALTIRGSVNKDIKRVAVYVNDKEVENAVWVDNGNFKYEYPVEKEGLYRIQAASISGFPVRKRSERSPIMAINVDWTAPSKTVVLKYQKEVDVNTLKVSGEAEPLSTVVFSSAGSKYTAKVDKNGKFSTTLPLTVGSNNYEVEIRDDAGNSVKAENPLIATRITGSINGNGASVDPELPESAGELEAALAFLQGNKVMGSFGVIALIVLAINSLLVLAKVRRYSI
ncbi:hypothetical protein HYV12_00500 [Candidatus Dojkabacteria bacterium]|nr:hypothetical protein [Candidatus Dojkabacteria bacterium]